MITTQGIGIDHQASPFGRCRPSHKRLSSPSNPSEDRNMPRRKCQRNRDTSASSYDLTFSIAHCYNGGIGADLHQPRQFQRNQRTRSKSWPSYTAPASGPGNSEHPSNSCHSDTRAKRDRRTLYRSSRMLRLGIQTAQKDTESSAILAFPALDKPLLLPVETTRHTPTFCTAHVTCNLAFHRRNNRLWFSRQAWAGTLYGKNDHI
jgi:hypothetical protein